MITSMASTPVSTPPSSPGSSAFSFITAPGSPNTPSPSSTPAGELATSLAASIATLSTAVATLAKERRTLTLLGTVSALSGTITSLASVVAALAQCDTPTLRLDGATRHDALIIPIPKKAQEENREPLMSPTQNDAEIEALKTALATVQRESKIRLHHQRVTLVAKHKRTVEHAKRQLASKDRKITDFQMQNNLLTKNASLQNQHPNNLLNELEEKEVDEATENLRLIEETEHLRDEIDRLVAENSRIVGDNQHLVRQNATLDDENIRLVGANQRLTYENGLHADIHTEHQQGIVEIEHLNREVQRLKSDNRSLSREVQGLTSVNKDLTHENANLASEKQRMVSDIGQYVELRRDTTAQKERLVQQVQLLTSEREPLVDEIQRLRDQNNRLLDKTIRLSRKSSDSAAAASDKFPEYVSCRSTPGTEGAMEHPRVSLDTHYLGDYPDFPLSANKKL